MSEDYAVPIALWLACVALPLLSLFGALWLRRRRVIRESLKVLELELKWMGVHGDAADTD